jgi:hypothetical protein
MEEFMATSAEQSNSTRLSFNSHQDALNYVEHIVEDALRWEIDSRIAIADRYEKGKVEIVLEFLAVGCASKLSLIFRGIPQRNSKRIWPDESSVLRAGKGSHTHQHNGLMFIGITEIVQTPQKVIPSEVWLGCDHQVKDFFRDVLGTSICSTLDFGEINAERELRKSSSVDLSGSIASLIENTSQITNDIEGASGECIWNRLDELGFMHVLHGFRIELNDVLARVFLTESIHFPFKFLKSSLGVP